MTKLLEWLVVLGALLSVWLALITNKIENSFVTHNYDMLLYSPIIFVGLFGLYALTVVLYRVYMFNNCNEAAAELQKEIIEAKEDLAKLGFKFSQRTHKKEF